MEKHKKTYKNLYFLGIGGIGMSALARYFHAQGLSIAGYDRDSTEIIDLLKTSGIAVTSEDHAEALPGHWKLAETAVVYTPAITKESKHFKQFESLGLPFYKRSEVLGWISEDLPTIAIAGTHGKTTTTAIVTHVLKTAGIPVLSFIGGISGNYGSNVVIDKDPTFLVVEADEFDRSFLKLTPKYAVITSVDADHLDIYGNDGFLLDAFKSFAESTQNGVVAEKAVLEKVDLNALVYGAGDSDIEHYAIENNKAHLVFKDGERTCDFNWSMPGRYNALNALSAFCISNKLGIDTKTFSRAMETFLGVKRRFETVYEGANGILIDDYAHHPTELAALRSALVELYPDKSITLVFQPHLYSRTRDFLKEFAAELSAFDKVMLMPIYPAREEPIPGVNTQALLAEMGKCKKQQITPLQLLEYASDLNGEVLVMVGAGDISKMVEPVKKILSRV